MLGLGTGIVKGGGRLNNLGIITDNLVLKHNYDTSQVRQVSTGAAFFDGTDDYISLGTSLNLGTDDFSISAWIYFNESTNQYIINKKQDANNYWFLRTQGTDSLQFFTKVGGTTIMDRGYDGSGVPSADIPHNTWTHCVVTCDRSDGSSGIKIYANGVKGNTDGGASATDMDNTGDLRLGNDGGSAFMDGYMTNVGIWSRVLTGAEVKSIMWKNYDQLISSEKTSMVSWWNLSTDANDSHGSNNGTLS